MSDTREIFDSLTQAINRHDAGTAAKRYDAHAVVQSPEGNLEGREAVLAFYSGFFDAFPDLTVTVWSKVTSGDVVCDEWTLSGTNTGPFPLPDGATLAPTGNRVEIRGCDVAAVENGQVISHRLYYNNLDLLEQLGIAS